VGVKGAIKGFEMASGIKVKFFKSCLIGINVERDFMEMRCGNLCWIMFCLG
jgi:hypothetical protein